MFEAAEVGHEISKAQYALKENGRFPVLVLISGVDGAGKGETVNRHNEWMDPRRIQTVAFPPPSDQERQRPRLWCYWMARGRIGVLFGSWYADP